MKKLCSILLLVVTLFSAFNVTALAAESRGNIEAVVAEYDNQSNEIIGWSKPVPSPKIPNLLIVNWTATESTVVITVFNGGIDTVDTFAGTVKIGTNSTPFTSSNLAPLSTKTITVNVNMLKCHEDITVNSYGIDGGSEFGKGTTTGSRDMPSTLSSSWHQGTFASVSASIEYHFGKHKAGVGSTNICAYVRSAQGFKSNLSGATTSPVTGGTPNVTRYKKNGKFIDICGTQNTGLIISYGKS